MDAVLEEAHDDVAESEGPCWKRRWRFLKPRFQRPSPRPSRRRGGVRRPAHPPTRPTLHALGTPRPTAVLKPAMPVLPLPEKPRAATRPTMTPRQLTPVERLEPSDED